MGIREAIEILQRRADFLAERIVANKKPQNLNRDRAEISAILQAIQSLSKDHNPTARTETRLSAFLGRSK